VRRVDQVDPRVQAHVDLTGRVFHVGVADVGEGPPAAEGHRAEREGRDPKAGATELAVFHGGVLSSGDARRGILRDRARAAPRTPGVARPAAGYAVHDPTGSATARSRSLRRRRWSTG